MPLTFFFDAITDRGTGMCFFSHSISFPLQGFCFSAANTVIDEMIIMKAVNNSFFKLKVLLHFIHKITSYVYCVLSFDITHHIGNRIFGWATYQNSEKKPAERAGFLFSRL